MSDIEPPIAGMKVAPFGLPLMLPGWLGLLSFAIAKPEILAQFKAETGHDLEALAHGTALDKLVDQATGRDRAMMVAFCDWVTVTYWGDGEAWSEIERDAPQW